MKIDGQFVVRAPRAAVWEALNDPAVLSRAIPGCEQLEPRGDNRFDVVVKAGIGAIKGTFKGGVSIENVVPPESYVLSIDGTGPGGFIKGRGHITLSEAGTDTAVSISGDAQAGGMIASVGQRLLASGAKLMMSEFFKGLEREAKRAADVG